MIRCTYSYYQHAVQLLNSTFSDTESCTFSDTERQLISLPSRLGGLGIINPCISSAFQFEALRKVTGLLISLLLEQDPRFTIIIMIVMHRPQKEYDVHVLISYIYKLSACDS